VDVAAAGLAAAVDALRVLATAPRGSTLATLIERADSSVRAIDRQRLFGFARPQIQDALRAIADAYFVLATQDRGPSHAR
jgi:hypothetical protein